MAQPDYSGVPTQQAQPEAANDLQRVDVTPADFGAGLAEGLQQAGAGITDLAKFYDKVSADQATNNLLDLGTKALYGDPSKPATDANGQPILGPDGKPMPDTGYFGKKGADAMHARGEVQDTLNEIIAEQRENLKTPEARLQFDDDSRRQRSLWLSKMGEYADQQQVAWGKDTNATALTLALNQAAINPGDDEAAAQATEQARNAAVKNAQLEFGNDPSVVQGAILKADQGIAQARLRSAIGQNNGPLAQKLFDQYSPILGSMPDYDQLSRQVKETVFNNVESPAVDKAVGDAISGAQAQVAASAAPGGPGAPAPTGPVYDQIGKAAAAHGATPNEVNFLQREALIESRGNPAAQNGASTGVFQFHLDTFAGLGGGNIHDVGDQTAAALRGARQNATLLTNAGAQTTDANLYIMHQQGPAGGLALLGHPDESAVAVLTPIYHGNAAIATRAIVGNGGTADMTAGQFTAMWTQRFGGGGTTGATSSVADNLRMTMPSLLEKAQTDAEALFPNYPDYQARYVQNVERRLNQTISQQDQQYLADTHMVMQASEGATSFADIRARGPQASAALDRMAIENPLAYNSLERRFDANSGEKAESFGTGFSGYLSRALAPTNDPNRITNPMQLNPFVGAGKDAALTTAGQTALAGITAIRGTPQGEAFITQARGILGQVHGDLTFSSGPLGLVDKKGEEAFTAFSAQALPILLNAYKSGNINQVLSPKSPDYIGNLAQHFMRTPSEIMRDRTDLGTDQQFQMRFGKGGIEEHDQNALGLALLKHAVDTRALSPQEAIRIGRDMGLKPPPPRAQAKAAAPPGPQLQLPPIEGENPGNQ